MNARFTPPPGFQQAPVIQAFGTLADENDTLFRVLQEIAGMDSRDGRLMQETAADAVRMVLEARIDAKIKARMQ